MGKCSEKQAGVLVRKNLLIAAATGALLGSTAAAAAQELFELSFSGTSGLTGSGSFDAIVGSGGTLSDFTNVSATQTLNGVTYSSATISSGTWTASGFNLSLAYNPPAAGYASGGTQIYSPAMAGTNGSAIYGTTSATVTAATMTVAPFPAPGGGILSFLFLAVAALRNTVKSAWGQAATGIRSTLKVKAAKSACA